MKLSEFKREQRDYSFVWRSAQLNRWRTTVITADSPAAAIAKLERHFTHKLKKSLTEVVVDHPFYSRNPDDSKAPVVNSLRDHASNLHFEFKNQVWGPDNRPENKP
ncbi:hypothetical protein LC612_31395 [Nostoc sp. CHAB 5834]|nr:hypothetical protein [Nostoc sp. CHAB 5834]